MPSVQIVRLRINSYEDRNNMVLALANAGYKVWILKKEDTLIGNNYFVCYEYIEK